jgi:hypothetical protein
VDGLDDFAAVDALQVDRGDAEVAVSELALDDDQPDAFASHLDGVSVPQLVRREAAPNACRDGGATQLGAGRSRRPMASARRAVEHAAQWTDRKLAPQLESGLKLFPAPGVHADLATTPALAAPNQQ